MRKEQGLRPDVSNPALLLYGRFFVGTFRESLPFSCLIAALHLKKLFWVPSRLRETRRLHGT
jgi:hypothetical protein